MEATVRIIIIFAVLSCLFAAEENPPKIGSKVPSRFEQMLRLVSSVTVSSLGAYISHGWLSQIGGEIGNQVVLQPFLLGSWALLWGGGIFLVAAKGQRKFTRLEKQLQVLMPVVIVIAIDTLTTPLQAYVCLAFFFIAGWLLAGIQSRIRYAPIPPFLQGLPIQLVSLGLISLGLSFFRGIFFEKLF